MAGFLLAGGRENQVRDLHFVTGLPVALSSAVFPLPVADDELWWIESIHVLHQTSASAGTRIPALSFLDDTNTRVLTFAQGSYAANSQTVVSYGINGPVAVQGANNDRALVVPMPLAFALSGWSVRFVDTANIDTAGDQVLSLIMALWRQKLAKTS